MKRLTLVRHGHAEARAEGGDFFRELSPQGRAEAARTAMALRTHLPPPELMKVSEALRTRETARWLHEHFRSADSDTTAEIPLDTTPRLYHASVSTLLDVIYDTPTTIQHLLIVGHNPGLSELAQRWVQHIPLDHEFGGLPTAGW